MSARSLIARSVNGSDPADIRADADQIALLRIAAPQLLERHRACACARASTSFGITREIDASTSIAGKCAGIGEAPAQHDVAVENRARSIDDRILMIVAFGEHRVERSHRAGSPTLPACSTSRGNNANTDGG